MTIQAGNGYSVRIEETGGLGSTWIVRVQKKLFVINTTVSSDWFLDRAQAQRFAEQLAEDIRSGSGLKQIKERKPGWILHRPPQR
jgi:hypothetical protein